MIRNLTPFACLLLAPFAFTACAIVQVGGSGSSTTGTGGSSDSSGSTTGTGGTSTGSSGQGGTGGGSTGSNGKIYGAYWTGTAEAVDSIDPATGAGTFVGNLGDLNFWSGQLVLDQAGAHAYAVGTNAAMQDRLYDLDLATGSSSQAPIAHGYALAGVTEDGHVLGAYWNGVTEDVDSVDPATGTGTLVGHLGDLKWWSNQITYDHKAHVVHAIGSNALDALHIYSLSLATQVNSSVAITTSPSYVLGGVTATGMLLGAHWNGSAEVVSEIDPATGAATAHGQLGDLMFWSNSLVLDGAANRAIAIGFSPSKVQKVYALDLGTQASTGVPVAHSYDLAKP